MDVNVSNESNGSNGSNDRNGGNGGDDRNGLRRMDVVAVLEGLTQGSSRQRAERSPARSFVVVVGRHTICGRGRPHHGRSGGAGRLTGPSLLRARITKRFYGTRRTHVNVTCVPPDGVRHSCRLLPFPPLLSLLSLLSLLLNDCIPGRGRGRLAHDDAPGSAPWSARSMQHPLPHAPGPPR